MFIKDIRLHCSDLSMTSTLKLDKADQELVTDSGSADEGDSVSGSELARKKNPHTSCTGTSAASHYKTASPV